MARCEPVDRSARLPPALLSERLLPGSFEFALDHLVDHELDLSLLDVGDDARPGGQRRACLRDIERSARA